MKNQFSIPKPCHENWNAMTPDSQGRFCGQCAKTVVDFTGMTTSQIQQHLITNSSNRICGRFTEEQLEPVTITIPETILFRQTQFHKMFLLALLLCMGATLLSCNGRTVKGEVETAQGKDTIVKTDSVMHLQGEIAPVDTLASEPDTLREGERLHTMGIVRKK